MDTRKRRKEGLVPLSPLYENLQISPKRAKVHAQRKFASSSQSISPAISPLKEIKEISGKGLSDCRTRLRSQEITQDNKPNGVLVPEVPTRPKTEDFLTFLCFRRTPMLPPELEFFETPQLIELVEDEARGHTPPRDEKPIKGICKKNQEFYKKINSKEYIKKEFDIEDENQNSPPLSPRVTRSSASLTPRPSFLTSPPSSDTSPHADLKHKRKLTRKQFLLKKAVLLKSKSLRARRRSLKLHLRSNNEKSNGKGILLESPKAFRTSALKLSTRSKAIKSARFLTLKKKETISRVLRRLGPTALPVPADDDKGRVTRSQVSFTSPFIHIKQEPKDEYATTQDTSPPLVKESEPFGSDNDFKASLKQSADTVKRVLSTSYRSVLKNKISSRKKLLHTMKLRENKKKLNRNAADDRRVTRRELHLRNELTNGSFNNMEDGNLSPSPEPKPRFKMTKSIPGKSKNFIEKSRVNSLQGNEQETDCSARSRPVRKTKQVAEVYLELISQKLAKESQKDKDFSEDEDNISISSIKELNAFAKENKEINIEKCIKEISEKHVKEAKDRMDEKEAVKKINKTRTTRSLLKETVSPTKVSKDGDKKLVKDINISGSKKETPVKKQRSDSPRQKESSKSSPKVCLRASRSPRSPQHSPRLATTSSSPKHHLRHSNKSRSPNSASASPRRLSRSPSSPRVTSISKNNDKLNKQATPIKVIHPVKVSPRKRTLSDVGKESQKEKSVRRFSHDCKSTKSLESESLLKHGRRSSRSDTDKKTDFEGSDIHVDLSIVKVENSVSLKGFKNKSSKLDINTIVDSNAKLSKHGDAGLSPRSKRTLSLDTVVSTSGNVVKSLNTKLKKYSSLENVESNTKSDSQVVIRPKHLQITKGAKLCDVKIKEKVEKDDIVGKPLFARRRNSVHDEAKLNEVLESIVQDFKKDMDDTLYSKLEKDLNSGNKSPEKANRSIIETINRVATQGVIVEYKMKERSHPVGTSSASTTPARKGSGKKLGEVLKNLQERKRAESPLNRSDVRTPPFLQELKDLDSKNKEKPQQVSGEQVNMQKFELAPAQSIPLTHINVDISEEEISSVIMKSPANHSCTSEINAQIPSLEKNESEKSKCESTPSEVEVCKDAHDESIPSSIPGNESGSQSVCGNESISPSLSVNESKSPSVSESISSSMSGNESSNSPSVSSVTTTICAINANIAATLTHTNVTKSNGNVLTLPNSTTNISQTPYLIPVKSEPMLSLPISNINISVPTVAANVAPMAINPIGSITNVRHPTNQMPATLVSSRIAHIGPGVAINAAAVAPSALCSEFKPIKSEQSLSKSISKQILIAPKPTKNTNGNSNNSGAPCLKQITKPIQIAPKLPNSSNGQTVGHGQSTPIVPPPQMGQVIHGMSHTIPTVQTIPQTLQTVQGLPQGVQPLQAITPTLSTLPGITSGIPNVITQPMELNPSQLITPSSPAKLITQPGFVTSSMANVMASPFDISLQNQLHTGVRVVAQNVVGKVPVTAKPQGPILPLNTLAPDNVDKNAIPSLVPFHHSLQSGQPTQFVAVNMMPMAPSQIPISVTGHIPSSHMSPIICSQPVGIAQPSGVPVAYSMASISGPLNIIPSGPLMPLSDINLGNAGLIQPLQCVSANTIPTQSIAPSSSHMGLVISTMPNSFQSIQNCPMTATQADFTQINTQIENSIVLNETFDSIISNENIDPNLDSSLIINEEENQDGSLIINEEPHLSESNETSAIDESIKNSDDLSLTNVAETECSTLKDDSDIVNKTNIVNTSLSDDIAQISKSNALNKVDISLVSKVPLMALNSTAITLLSTPSVVTSPAVSQALSKLFPIQQSGKQSEILKDCNKNVDKELVQQEINSKYSANLTQPSQQMSQTVLNNLLYTATSVVIPQKIEKGMTSPRAITKVSQSSPPYVLSTSTSSEYPKPLSDKNMSNSEALIKNKVTNDKQLETNISHKNIKENTFTADIKNFNKSRNEPTSHTITHVNHGSESPQNKSHLLTNTSVQKTWSPRSFYSSSISKNKTGKNNETENKNKQKIEGIKNNLQFEKSNVNKNNDLKDKTKLSDLKDKTKLSDLKDKTKLSDLKDKTKLSDLKDKTKLSDLKDKTKLSDLKDKTKLSDLKDKTKLSDLKDKTKLTHIKSEYIDSPTIISDEAKSIKTLEKMKEPIVKKKTLFKTKYSKEQKTPGAFSPLNESSVYAFEPELETPLEVTTPFYQRMKNIQPTPQTVKNIQLTTPQTVKNIQLTTPQTVKNIHSTTPQTVKNIQPTTPQTVKNVQPNNTQNLKNMQPTTPQNLKNIQPNSAPQNILHNKNNSMKTKIGEKTNYFADIINAHSSSKKIKSNNNKLVQKNTSVGNVKNSSNTKLETNRRKAPPKKIRSLNKKSSISDDINEVSISISILPKSIKPIELVEENKVIKHPTPVKHISNNNEIPSEDVSNSVTKLQFDAIEKDVVINNNSKTLNIENEKHIVAAKDTSNASESSIDKLDLAKMNLKNMEEFRVKPAQKENLRAVKILGRNKILPPKGREENNSDKLPVLKNQILETDKMEYKSDSNKYKDDDVHKYVSDIDSPLKELDDDKTKCKAKEKKSKIQKVTKVAISEAYRHEDRKKSEKETSKSTSSSSIAIQCDLDDNQIDKKQDEKKTESNVQSDKTSKYPLPPSASPFYYLPLAMATLGEKLPAQLVQQMLAKTQGLVGAAEAGLILQQAAQLAQQYHKNSDQDGPQSYASSPAVKPISPKSGSIALQKALRANLASMAQAEISVAQSSGVQLIANQLKPNNKSISPKDLLQIEIPADSDETISTSDTDVGEKEVLDTRITKEDNSEKDVSSKSALTSRNRENIIHKQGGNSKKSIEVPKLDNKIKSKDSSNLKSEKEGNFKSEKECNPKSKKEDNPKSKKEDNPKSKKEDNPKSKKEDNPNSKKEDNPKNKKEDNPKSKKEDNPKRKKEDNPKSKKEDNPKSKKEDNPKSVKESNPKSKKESNPKCEKDNTKVIEEVVVKRRSGRSLTLACTKATEFDLHEAEEIRRNRRARKAAAALTKNDGWNSPSEPLSPAGSPDLLRGWPPPRLTSPSPSQSSEGTCSSTPSQRSRLSASHSRRHSPAGNSDSRRRSRHSGSSSNINFPTDSITEPGPWLIGDNSKLIRAPSFFPSEEEFNEPLDYIEKIRPEAEQFGLCRIVPPSNFRPECRVNDDMRFTAYKQYIHRMMNRWGQNDRTLWAIKKCLSKQDIELSSIPMIGGLEIDLVNLHEIVDQYGGLMNVIEKELWTKVADAIRIPKSTQDRVTKLDNIYCKYLLPYAMLSSDEREQLLKEVDESHQGEGGSKKESSDNDDEDEDEPLECMVKGKSISLSAFYRVAKNFASQWQPDPNGRKVDEQYWDIVKDTTNHVCVHAASIDTADHGYGFPNVKTSPSAIHPWNLKNMVQSPNSILRNMSGVIGVTAPTLHVGMMFSTVCWYRDPHSLSWIEYLHSGACKVWYGVSSNNEEKFKKVLQEIVPDYVKDSKIWLPSDTAMIPPNDLIDKGVKVCRVVQEPGQFVVVFPGAFTSSLCSGYLISESAFFARPQYFDRAVNSFKTLYECCEPSMFSLDRLVLSVASDCKATLDALVRVRPLLFQLLEREKREREILHDLGLTSSERMSYPESYKKKKNKYADDDEETICEICRQHLYLSLVSYFEDNAVYCLEHAIVGLKSKEYQLKNCVLMFTFSLPELNSTLKQLDERIEQKTFNKKASLAGKRGRLLERSDSFSSSTSSSNL